MSLKDAIVHRITRRGRRQVAAEPVHNDMLRAGDSGAPGSLAATRRAEGRTAWMRTPAGGGL
ncbi:hypothetical protein [Yinghuangia seranimata]|uniref:hypothetical protein n=1 Tax=Yinghuangia seranimata TaxID=408067 RepID=UPI00248B5BEE|nr:hypothetical protein [Yinghuangia seranimata]MDI2129560.1 hypothetical protein [Yinghuangia seranimata]